MASMACLPGHPGKIILRECKIEERKERVKKKRQEKESRRKEKKAKMHSVPKQDGWAGDDGRGTVDYGRPCVGSKRWRHMFGCQRNTSQNSFKSSPGSHAH